MSEVSRMKIDLLMGKDQRRCAECDDPFGIYFAVDGGICMTPMCFKCIMVYVDEQNGVI